VLDTSLLSCDAALFNANSLEVNGESPILVRVLLIDLFISIS